MNKKQAELVQYKVDNEGGMYDCFAHYSAFTQIKDAKFRRLVKAFCDAGEELGNYLDAEYKRHGLSEDDE